MAKTKRKQLFKRVIKTKNEFLYKLCYFVLYKIFILLHLFAPPSLNAPYTTSPDL